VEVPEVRFADVDGVSIAWQQFGSGPDVLMVGPIVSNMELRWEHEFYRRYLQYLGRYVRVTAFDKRGVGLSDKVHELPTLERRTDDIIAVMDAAGLGKPVLLGQSEGGLMAQLFAATHADRVARLVLVNSAPGAAFPPFQRPNANVRRFIETWGRDPQVQVDWMSPSHSQDAAFVRWWGRFQRQSATAADMRQQTKSFLSLDAVPYLAGITLPTLVIQVTGDSVIPVDAGRYLAARIPGARLVEVPGDDHLAETAPNWQEIADVWLEFATGSRPVRRTERCAAAVLFTDIVDSTARTALIGDEAWRSLLDSHDRIAWETADRHGGVIVKSTGDGLVARFEAPSRALEFATEFRHALEGLGLEIRCGLHAGEIELRDNGDITGAAVNLAARVEQAAENGSILVSSTVREMLLGADFGFSDRGEHLLKGFDTPWRLFALTDESPAFG
jgi:class 3 adenylate cyclase